MKKVLFALAIAGMFGFVACNNNKNAEEPEEVLTETVETATEEVMDTTAVEEVIEEGAVEEVATEVAE